MAEWNLVVANTNPRFRNMAVFLSVLTRNKSTSTSTSSNASNFQSAGDQFESRLRNRLTWLNIFMTFIVFGGRDRLFMGWMVRCLNPGACKRCYLLHTHPDRPWGPPRYRVILGSKAAGAWHWLPTPSRAEVKERAELYLYSASLSAMVCYEATLPLPHRLQRSTSIIN
jgi:hypothetical protein